jgi:predicted RNase H-like nuclease (RuvC/YqgF family)
MVSKLQAETSELKLSLATTQRDSSKYENEISELKKQLQEQTAITSTLRSELDTFTNIKLKQNLLEINAQNWENFNSQQQKAAQQVKTDLSELEGKLTRAIENKLLDLKTDNAATASFNVDDVVEKQNIRLREVELELRDSIDAKLSKLGRDLDNKYGTYC